MTEWLVEMDLLFGSHTSQDQRQSSFGSSGFLWKTARLLTPAVTFTNSRPVAAHRRKQAVTKTNEGGCRGGRAHGEVGWTSLSISQFHSQTGGPVAEPQARRPPTIYLTAVGSWWLRPCFWWICLCHSLPAQALQVGSWNKHVHLPDFPAQLLDWRKMRKNSPDHNFRGMKSNIW